MQVKRMAYIVDYFGKEVPKKLAEMDIHLVYISKRANYAVVYCDQNKGEQALKKSLSNIKGFKHISPSLFFDENVNI
mgnify:CR=1 FL=1